MKQKIIISLCILLFGCVFFFIYSNSIITLSLIDDSIIIIEYGSDFKVDNPIQYINTVGMNEDKTNKLKANLTTSTLPVDDDGKLAVGTYNLTFTFEEQAVTKKLEVKDTVAPVFNDTNEVSFEEGTIYDFNTTIKATDSTEVTMTFGGVDTNVVGEHTLKAIATDSNGNTTTKDIRVTITAKPVVEEPETSATTSQGGNSSTTSGSSSSSSSSTGSTSSGSTSTPTPTPQPTAPTQNDCYGVTNNFRNYFTSRDTAISAADNWIYNNMTTTGYTGYGLNYCTGHEKVGVSFYKVENGKRVYMSASQRVD